MHVAGFATRVLSPFRTSRWGPVTRRTAVVLVVWLATTGLSVSPASAAEPSLKERLDEWIETEMEARSIPGMAVVVILDGEIVYRSGHGVEDIDTGTPVDPASTGFHLGSISKTVTATEVMRLAQDGHIDLDQTIDRYLGDDTPPGTAPTLRQLLSHAGGYEQHAVGTGATGPDGFLTLGAYLAARPPLQVAEPGEATIYSSVGFAVAGGVVERVTGLAFSEAMKTGILRQLDMTDTVFPIPPVDPATAAGYRMGGDGRLVPYSDPYYSLVGPGGDVVSTVDDMTKLLEAHLQPGLLDATGLEEMHRIHVRNHPALRGRALGFSEWRHGNDRGLFQDGGAPGFLSRLFIAPDRRFGFFVAHNRGDEYALNRDFTRFLLDLMPAPRASAHPVAFVDTGDVRPGHYRGYATSLRGLGRFAGLLDEVDLVPTSEGLLVGNTEYAARGDGTFIADDGRQAAFTSIGGRRHLVIGTTPFREVGRWESRPVQLAGIGVVVVVLAAATAVTSVAALRHRHVAPTTLVASLAGVVIMACVAAIGVALAPSLADPWTAVTGPPPLLRPAVVVAGLATVAAGTGILLPAGAPPHQERLHSAAAKTVALSGILLVAWTMWWGLA